tara:strand:- start:283 stop:2352 length:2070 start_codon:yes stop_codon:yes gene_type:complete
MAERQRGNQYSIYQQKDLEGTFVDWGQIASDLTTGLEAISANREAQRQKIADDTTAAMNTLSEIADVNNPSMNTALIDASDLSTKSLQANYDLVRRGLLDIKDFNIMMQRQKDGYASLSNFAKNYDAKYQEALTRIANGEASALEEFWKDTSHKFGNMKNKKIWTNPANGELMLVEMIDDGKGGLKMPDANNPDHKKFFHTPSQMLKISDYQEQKIDTTEYVKDSIVSPLASVISSEMDSYDVLLGGAGIEEIKNFRQLFDLTNIGGGVTYDDWMASQITEVVGSKNEDGTSNSNRAAQVLAQKGYTFTEDPSKAGGKVILTISDENGQPSVQLTAEQFKAAEREALIEIESQLDLEVANKQPVRGEQKDPPTSNEIAKQDEIDKTVGYIKDLNTVLTGDEVTAKTTLKGMIETSNVQRSQQNPPLPLIDGFDMTDDYIVFYMSDGSTITRDRTVQDDPDTAEDETSANEVQQDLASIYDILAPGAQGIKTGMSDAQIYDFIRDQKITIGEKGEDRSLTLQGGVKAPKKVSANAANSQGKSIQSIITDELGTLDQFNSKGEIIEAVDEAIALVLRGQALKNFQEAGYTNVRSTIANGKIYIDYVDENGKDKFISLGDGSAKNGRTQEQTANAIAEAINELNRRSTEQVNKARGGRAGKKSFKAWSADNPREEGETFQDYVARYKKQFKF